MFRSPPPSVSKTLDNVSRENNCPTPSSNSSTKGELLSYGPHRNTSPKLIARQLNNTTHYIKIHPNPIPPLVRSITQFLNYMRDNLHIDHTTYKFLLPHSSPRTPLFYLLPKFHKPNNPGHPIISGCDCPSDYLSKYVDHYLKPLVPLIPSNIKDTTLFLNTIFQIPTPLPHNTILVTIDVTSFYTNIPNNKTAIHALSTHTHHIHPYKTFALFSPSSSNRISSYSTINTTSKHKAPPWVHVWPHHTQTFSWLSSKNVCYTIPLKTSNP